MISRLTASAALFATLATAGLAVAAEAQQRSSVQRIDATAAMPMVTMPRVEANAWRATELPAGSLPASAGPRKACFFNGRRWHEPSPARQADSLPRRLTEIPAEGAQGTARGTEMNESVLPRGDHTSPCGMSGPALHEFPG